jgi:hypothetical protein
VDFILVLIASLGYRLARHRTPIVPLSDRFVKDSDVRYLWVPSVERRRQHQ